MPPRFRKEETRAAAGACQSLIGRSRTFGRQDTQLGGCRSDVDPADLPYAQSPFEASTTANPSPRVGSLPALRSQLEGLTPRHREPAVTTVFRRGPPQTAQKGLRRLAQRRRLTRRPDASVRTSRRRRSARQICDTRCILSLEALELRAVGGSRTSARLSCGRSAHLCFYAPHVGFYLIAPTPF